MSRAPVWQWEKNALRGEPCPSDCRSFIDSAYYMALSMLYRAYKCGAVSKDEGSELKDDLYKKYAFFKSEEDFLHRESFKLSSRITETSEAFLKDRTVENAIRMYEAFYNTKIGDNT